MNYNDTPVRTGANAQSGGKTPSQGGPAKSGGASGTAPKRIKTTPVSTSARRQTSAASRNATQTKSQHTVKVSAAKPRTAKAGTAQSTARSTAQSGTTRPSTSIPQHRTRTQGAGIRHKRRKSAPKWAGVLLAVCAVALLGVGYVGVTQVADYMDYVEKCKTLEQNTFYDGITLEGNSLSGMTLFDAIEKFTGELSDVASSTQITVTAMGNTYTLDSGSVQMNSDLQATLNKAYSIGRSGTFEERYAQVQQLATNGMDFSLNRGWNEELLREKISEIASDIYVQGKNATVDTFDPDTGKFTFTSEVTGYELDQEDLYSQITQAIANGNVTTQIEAKVDVIEPEYDVAYMEANFGRISVMTTETTSDSNRNNNIRLATACFNGMRVEPGETVSFNDTTGPRSEDKGYKPAGAYSGGVLIEEPGGGVCQVSTTLYNAVVKAGLEIVERSPHSRPVKYVDIGLDAAVDYGNQDFQFKNNTDFPIFIVGEYYDQTLTFKIYGKQMDDGVYIMTEGELVETLPALTTVTERYDSSLPAGTTKDEPAREGYKAVSYMIYYDANNNEIKREVLANSTYRASGIIRLIGTG